MTGSTLLSSAVRQKLFFFKVHFFVTHPHKHFSRSITKKCHRHVHNPPATILHSMTNCAIGSQSFLLQISFLANFEGKMLLSKRRWTRSTLWTRFSEPPTRRKVRKKALKTFTQLRKCVQRSKKHANMRSRCSPDREQEGKDTFFFDFGGRFLDRWCSFSLVLFPSAIYSCQGDLATCFTCLHQSKASQNNPRGVANLGLQTCMQPDVLQHATEPVSPACRSTQTTGLVTSIVVLSSHERHRHCVTREKNSFPFVLGTAAESPELFAILPAASAASARRSTKHETGSEGGGTVYAVGWECSRQ